MQPCGNCKSKSWIHWHYRDGRECCDRCDGSVKITGTPDVYFKGEYWDENLTDPKDPSTWEKGTYVTSRQHKAHLMKKFGLKESGDRIRGGRSFDPIAFRHAEEIRQRR